MLLLLSNPLPRQALCLLFDYILKNGEREYLFLSKIGAGCLYALNCREEVFSETRGLLGYETGQGSNEHLVRPTHGR